MSGAHVCRREPSGNPLGGTDGGRELEHPRRACDRAWPRALAPKPPAGGGASRAQARPCTCGGGPGACGSRAGPRSARAPPARARGGARAQAHSRVPPAPAWSSGAGH
eukprot:11466780-Alexandrium_andersonii.AAC.1